MALFPNTTTIPSSSSSLSAEDITAAGGALAADLTAEATLARNADNLTSGTVSAARLPGVLANVDTQAELLSAAAAAAASHTHTLSNISDLAGLDLTALTAWPSGLTMTELGYVGGLTSDAQTQINGKAASSHTHAASDLASGQVALARGGTNADLSATGGATHVLRQASTGAAITVGALAASDIPSLGASKITSEQLALARGGTNADLSATGGASQYLKQASSGAAVTVGVIPCGDLPMPQILQLTRITSATSGLTGSFADNTLPYNETTTNEGNNWTVSNGVATCVTAGRYLLLLHSALDQAQGDIYWLVKNSTKIAEEYTGTYQTGATYTVASFAANDTLKTVVAGSAGPVVQPGAKMMAIFLGKAS